MGTRSPQREQTRQGSLEGETTRHYCWWRPSFKCQEPEEEVEREAESTQDCGEHVDTPSVT